MGLILLIKTLVLSLVEGATEFLPVSSTGHLILVGDALGTTGHAWDSFAIFIQLGAILAVVWEYRRRLYQATSGLFSGCGKSWRFWINIGVAFVPAAVVGLLAAGSIKAYLFNPLTVAAALAAGAVVILVVEGRSQTPRVEHVADMRWTDALVVGVAQVAALIPGMSRSAATIMGGMMGGLARSAGTEFSFFLAIPTLTAATFYDLYKNLHILSMADIPVFAVGFVASFVFSLLAVKWLLRFVATHDFRPFAWYRLALAALVLAVYVAR